MLTPRHAPAAELATRLTFAPRYEGPNLMVFARLFHVVSPAKIAAIVEASPMGAYARRVWYEWLTGSRLDLPDAAGLSHMDFGPGRTKNRTESRWEQFHRKSEMFSIRPPYAIPLPDAGRVRAVEVVDPELQLAISQGTPSTRPRVINNLPGTPAFCPMVRRTNALEAYRAL